MPAIWNFWHCARFFYHSALGIEKINEIQESLNVKLPESYKWFLKNYGAGGIYGVDILDHGKVSPRVVTFSMI